MNDETLPPQASDYTLPDLTIKFWQELEKILQKKLPESVREKIKCAMENYVVARFFLRKSKTHKEAASRPKGKTTPASGYFRTLKKLVKQWNDLKVDPKSQHLIEAFTDDIKIRSKGTANIENAMTTLEVAVTSYGLFMRNEKPKTSPMKAFIRQVSDILRKAEIKVTNRGDFDAFGKVSPFVNAIIRLEKEMPHAAKNGERNFGTWSNIIKDALPKRA